MLYQEKPDSEFLFIVEEVLTATTPDRRNAKSAIPSANNLYSASKPECIPGREEFACGDEPLYSCQQTTAVRKPLPLKNPDASDIRSLCVLKKIDL